MVLTAEPTVTSTPARERRNVRGRARRGERPARVGAVGPAPPAVQPHPGQRTWADVGVERRDIAAQPLGGDPSRDELAHTADDNQRRRPAGSGPPAGGPSTRPESR